jgi:porphobilinogen deaminase
MKTMLASLDGSVFIYENGKSSLYEAPELGKQLAQKILDRGGKEILNEIYK